MTAPQQVERLDYSRPPPGYDPADNTNANGAPADWYLTAAWAHYKKRHDPPGLEVNAYGFGQRSSDPCWWRPLSVDAALAATRAAAWAWHDRRLALAGRLDAWRLSDARAFISGVHENPWPRCLTWSDDQVTAVERWLVDSTAELPEVLRG